MKRNMVMATAAALCLAASGALAQCNNYDRLGLIGDGIGTGMVIDQFLDDGTEFKIYSSATYGISVVMVDGMGMSNINMFTSMSQDANGVSTVVNGDITCTFRCNGPDGMLITVVTPDIDEEWFGVLATGETVRVGRAAYRHVFNQAFSGGFGDMTLPVDAFLSPGTTTVPGVNSNNESFAVNAALVSEPQVDPEDESRAVSSWIGTLTTAAGTFPCTGLCTADNGTHLVLITGAFCDAQVGEAVIERAADASCEECEQIAVCVLDAQGLSEWGDLRRDDRSCFRTHVAADTTAIVGCGALAIVGCITSIIPNPASPFVCGAGIACFLGALGDGVVAPIRATNEYNRVKECICAHVADRANGASPSACSYSCPLY